jgi:hypothetical protein
MVSQKYQSLDTLILLQVSGTFELTGVPSGLSDAAIF